MQLHSELLSIRIEDAGKLVILRVDIVRGARMPLRQAIELFVGYLFRILQELLGPSWKPRRVLFTHPAPASLTRHVAMFGRIVDFEAEFNGIACAAEDLAGQLPSADPVMARYARQYLDAMISRPDMTLADKVRWLVRDMLPLGRCSVDKVAQHLGVDRRTVHRHLARSGETFSSLVDEVRAELAEGYLEGRRGRFADVADLLGFSAAQRVFALAQAPFRLQPDGKTKRLESEWEHGMTPRPVQQPEFPAASRFERVRWALIPAACLAVALLAAWLLQSTIPRHIVLASGLRDGMYHQYAQRYKEILAREGVTVEERMTGGADENERLLRDPKSGVDVAFVHGGVVRPAERGTLVMLAALYYEPLWIFYRDSVVHEHFDELRYKRIAVGSPDSGVRAFMEPLLAANDITALQHRTGAAGQSGGPARACRRDRSTPRSWSGPCSSRRSGRPCTTRT